MHTGIQRDTPVHTDYSDFAYRYTPVQGMRFTNSQLQVTHVPVPQMPIPVQKIACTSRNHKCRSRMYRYGQDSVTCVPVHTGTSLDLHFTQAQVQVKACTGTYRYVPVNNATINASTGICEAALNLAIYGASHLWMSSAWPCA